MLRGLARWIDALQEQVGRAVSWLMLALVVLVFGDVVLRYLFNTGAVFIQELEWYLFGTIYLLAAGYTLLYNEHVRVDVVYAKLPPRSRAWLDFVLLFVFFFPSCFLVIYTSWPFVKNSWDILEGSPDPGGIPLRWALKAVIILGFGVLAIQGVSQAIKTYYVARGWEEPDSRVKEIH